MKTILTAAIIAALWGCTSPTAPPTESGGPKTLKECRTKADSLHVLDLYYYGDGTELYPPCSLSPEYDRCIDHRYKTVTGGL